MSETQDKAPRAKAEVEQVTMTDGRTVGFAGKRKMVKETLEKGVRFDCPVNDKSHFGPLNLLLGHLGI